jgi:predicted AAA+ superfamily ATPase
VGKVEFLNLYPLNFEEFLLALGEEKLYELIKSCDWELIKIFGEKFISYLKMYFYVGGMPEVVSEFSKDRSFIPARGIQEYILDSYQKDFSKHIPLNQLQKIRQLWTSIPTQLAKENKKFVYGEVQKGARASVFEIPLLWLESCGLIHKISRVSKVAQPLMGYENTGAFKLFFCDIGLLSAMSMLNAKTLLDKNATFTEFKGALTEQFVCQELKMFNDMRIAYWANNNATAELDFIIQHEMQIIPIEVKSSTNLKAKSLQVYREKFHPQIEIRISLADYKKTDHLYDIPLYALGELKKIIC